MGKMPTKPRPQSTTIFIQGDIIKRIDAVVEERREREPWIRRSHLVTQAVLEYLSRLGQQSHYGLGDK